MFFFVSLVETNQCSRSISHSFRTVRSIRQHLPGEIEIYAESNTCLRYGQPFVHIVRSPTVRQISDEQKYVSILGSIKFLPAPPCICSVSCINRIPFINYIEACLQWWDFIPLTDCVALFFLVHERTRSYVCYEQNYSFNYKTVLSMISDLNYLHSGACI